MTENASQNPPQEELKHCTKDTSCWFNLLFVKVINTNDCKYTIEIDGCHVIYSFFCGTFLHNYP